MQLSPNLISHHAKSLALNVKVGKEDNTLLDKNVLLATYLGVVFSWFFLSPKVYSFRTARWVLSTGKTEEGKGSFTRLKKLYIFSNNNSLPVFLLICIKIVHNCSLSPIFTWREKKSEIYIPSFRENSTSNWMSPKARIFIHPRKSEIYNCKIQ